MFMERSTGFKFFMCILLLLRIRDAVSAAEACGKDEQCGLTYCGDPCGSRLFIHSGLCLICEAGQYFDFEKTCRCQPCNKTSTNNEPNIRGTCKDVRGTVTETPTSLPPATSSEPPMLPANNVPNINTTSMSDVITPKTQKETATDAPKTNTTGTSPTTTGTSPTNLPDEKDNSTHGTTIAPTVGSGEESPNPLRDILIGVGAVVGIGFVVVAVYRLVRMDSIAPVRNFWRRGPKMADQDFQVEYQPDPNTDPVPGEEREPFVDPDQL